MNKKEELLFNKVKNADLEKVQLLLYIGADVNCKDDDGWTPICLAAIYNHLDICKLLIEKGADCIILCKLLEKYYG
jgi:ankyrin repeat protein